MIESPLLLPAVSALVSGTMIALMIYSPLGRLLLDRPNARSLHVRPVPRAGGFGIVAAVAAIWTAAGMAPAWLAVVGPIAIVSAVDDWRGLPVVVRFAVHMAGAAVLLAWVAPDVAPGWQIFWFLAVVWLTNLYNFMDGANGLAGGMAVFGFGTCALAAHFAGQSALATACLCISAAALAFLAFNFHPARVFMGDVGSVPLGFLAGAIGMSGWHAGLWPFWFPFVAFGPFVADATVTLVRRASRGERFWEAHRSHYYQRLILTGWSHRRTALAAYGLMSVSSACALAGRAAPDGVQWLLAAGLLAVYFGVARGIDRRWRRHADEVRA